MISDQLPGVSRALSKLNIALAHHPLLYMLPHLPCLVPDDQPGAWLHPRPPRPGGRRAQRDTSALGPERSFATEGIDSCSIPCRRCESPTSWIGPRASRSPRISSTATTWSKRHEGRRSRPTVQTRSSLPASTKLCIATRSVFVASQRVVGLVPAPTRTFTRRLQRGKTAAAVSACPPT